MPHDGRTPTQRIDDLLRARGQLTIMRLAQFLELTLGGFETEPDVSRPHGRGLTLTRRERAMLQAIAAATLNRQQAYGEHKALAARLGRDPRAVAVHLSRMRRAMRQAGATKALDRPSQGEGLTQPAAGIS